MGLGRISVGLLLVLAMMPGTGRAQISSFRHIIVIFQENRTPDNLFQGLCVPPYGNKTSCSMKPTSKQYNIQTKNWFDKHSASGVTQPTALTLVSDYGLLHTHAMWANQCDMGTDGKCKMDGEGDVTCTPSSICRNYINPQFKYVDYTQDGILNPYLDMATQYGWANYMFQTNQGSSFPAHQYIFSATSAPDAASDHAGTFAAENTRDLGVTGCVADASSTVQLIDAFGLEDPLNVMFPCFEHKTIPDLLEPLGIGWKYYAPGPNGIWTAPNAIQHICQPIAGECTGPDWVNSVDLKSADVLTDIAKCSLAQVVWVNPTGDNSDHARDNTGGGPAWVASIVNAIGNSWTASGNKCDYWGNKTNDSTAIFITWDDWGGWYDHEPPAILPFPEGGYQLGLRVPLMVVSAYTPKRMIVNHRYDFGSVVRYIEHNFGIAEGALTFSDARSTSDLSAFFKLTQSPRTFQTIASPRDAWFFIHDPRPQTDPDED